MCNKHDHFVAGLFADLRAGKPEHPPWHPLAKKRRKKKAKRVIEKTDALGPVYGIEAAVTPMRRSKPKKRKPAKKKAKKKVPTPIRKSKKTKKRKPKAKKHPTPLRRSKPIPKRRKRRKRHKHGDLILIHTWVVDGDPCDVCDEMDGVTIEDGEEFEIDTWNDDGLPPVHPNCMCQIESQWVEYGGDEQ
jgi:outer membrane biosynthesis protein TonB